VTRIRPLTGKRVRHYKGGEYTILCEAFVKEPDTLERVIVYRGDDNRVFVRPEENFMEYLEDKGCYRFEEIGEESKPFDTYVLKDKKGEDRI
jgi:hypothetical protein